VPADAVRLDETAVCTLGDGFEQELREGDELWLWIGRVGSGQARPVSGSRVTGWTGASSGSSLMDEGGWIWLIP